jgi:hypothetical protein
MGKLIICVDFDGVVHDYMDGWRDGSVYGNAVPGFFEWALSAKEHFDLVIYSSRSKTEDGILAMQQWMVEQWKIFIVSEAGREVNQSLIWNLFKYANEKPPAWLTIDDRALCFNGNWSDPNFSVEAMRSFKPWNKPQ